MNIPDHSWEVGTALLQQHCVCAVSLLMGRLR